MIFLLLIFLNTGEPCVQRPGLGLLMRNPCLNLDGKCRVCEETSFKVPTYLQEYERPPRATPKQRNQEYPQRFKVEFSNLTFVNNNGICEKKCIKKLRQSSALYIPDDGFSSMKVKLDGKFTETKS